MTELATTIQNAVARSIGRDAVAVHELREFNEKQTGLDPARVAWPSTLIIELALKTASPQELKEHYDFSDEEWSALRYNPTFIKELGEMCETVKHEGMSFRLKARLQAEEMLKTSWRLVHGPASEVPAAVKAKLIETTFRVAGFDTKGEGIGAAGNSLNIQINLG